ncbi:Transcriptional regulatory protein DegU [Streptomyces sp. RB5]|uniref:Transcriptional regulatory protein DegU n=1 Tax=Streptomyces smaragdinus TaxID=2585196 RepID=A0A7K0CJT0_9ACTN|nr:response regulator transcription factor [Streptomyces smaragdinus]MQY13706.1 Transcriptional regulatory protein DegU [Streptomyces smaragdinus]
MTIRVLLADDEALVRAGVRLILRHAEDLEVVAEAGDGAAAVRLARAERPDVALVDVRMPGTDGIAAAGELAALTPAVAVVMLTTFGEEDYVDRALRAGASGFLLKDCAPEELIQGVRAAAAGDSVLSPKVTRHVLDRLRDTAPAGDPRGARARRLIGELTAREGEVLAMVGTGLSNAEIAGRLGVEPGTVKAHVGRILAKLGAANRVQAAIVAHEAGLSAPADSAE